MTTLNRRTFLTTTLAAAGAVSLAACNSSSADPNEGGGATVAFWVPNGPRNGVIEDHFAGWASDDGASVEVTAHPSDQMQDTVTLALRSGDGPDMWEGANPAIFNGGFAAPLDEVLSEENKAAYAAKMPSNERFMIDGVPYGVPTTANAIRMAYNKDVFEAAGLDPEAPPATFSEVRAACEAIAQLEGVYGFGLPMKWGGFNQWMMDPMIARTHPNVSQNGQWDHSTGRFEMLNYGPLVELMREMVTQEWAYPGASTLENDPMRQAFANGEIGMFISASWDLSVINDQFATDQNWAVAAAPYNDGETPVRQISNVAGVTCLNAATEDMETAAAAFNEYIGRDLWLTIGQQGLAFPARTDITADEVAEGQAPQFAGYLTTEEDTAWAPSPHQDMELRGELIGDLLRRLILGTDNIETELQNLADQYQETYDQGVEDGTINPDTYTT
ncbi:ABC transporter substrate-binding protein [Ruania rhizosphaerae]|uniref:ABC transporter substrate-binding protein n=1 Tax=Ruania rhizosphaerae TaxID=1840413 RepID=UPI001358805B|nr:extracellular solute-binding protein [Ruania rhizosphaerae]